MEILEVVNKWEEKAFLTIPRVVYKKDRNWVAMPDFELKSILNKAGDHWLLKRWIVRDDHLVLGRVVAFQKKADHTIGGFGFFECLPCDAAAQLLLKTAEDWLRWNGVKSIQAPVNPLGRDHYWGLLVEGFSRPSYRDAYQPAYYEAFFRNAGFHEDFKQHTFRIEPNNAVLGRVGEIYHNSNQTGIYLATLADLSEDQFIQDFMEVYHQTWDKATQDGDLSTEKLKASMSEARGVLLKQWLFILYVKGKPVGIFAALPDLNQFLSGFRGKLGLAWKLKLWFLLKTRNIRTARGIVFGIVPEWQRSKLTAVFLYLIGQRMFSQPTLKCIELSWIGSFNVPMLNLMRGIKAEPYKTHVTFVKSL